MFGDCLGHTGCFLSQAHVAFCRPLALSPLVPAVPPLGLGLAALSQRWFVLACCLAAWLCTSTCSEAGSGAVLIQPLWADCMWLLFPPRLTEGHSRVSR